MRQGSLRKKRMCAARRAAIMQMQGANANAKAFVRNPLSLGPGMIDGAYSSLCPCIGSISSQNLISPSRGLLQTLRC